MYRGIERPHADAMKSLTSISFSLAILSSLAAQAQSDTPPPVPETQAVVSAPAQPAHLAYGIDDVLKLARAKVGEEVIVAFVQSSGIAYSLRANDIVYLRDQGVTDHVISVMLSQKAAVNTASTAPAPPPTQPVQPPNIPPQDYTQPGGDYVQPVSSTYTIPYPTAAYPYYSSYYGYGYPYYYSSYYPYYGYGYGYCGYPYRSGYGYCGYPYRYGYGHGYNGHGYYGHGGHGLTAVHSGWHGGSSGWNGHAATGGRSGFTAVGGS